MKDYLKIIFSVALMVTIFAVPVQAQDPAPSPAPAPEAAKSTPDQSSQLQQAAPDQAASTENRPVQTDVVETDHAQKPAKEIHYYNYAHDEAEYSVSLPEAPTVSTIWGETAETKPFLRQPPTDHAALGEEANFKLIDMDTEELFDVRIYFLRATPAFLESLTDEKIHHMLKKKFSEVTLSNETFNASDGQATLKWATLSGFVLDAHHHPAFYAIHYLTGLQSILVIQVKYSIENKTFQEYYNHMVSSITYVQP